MDKDTGGPAFPTTEFNHAGQIIPGSDGMTMRDYFAAKALQRFIGTEDENGMRYDQVSKVCYMYADAMLKARNQ